MDEQIRTVLAEHGKLLVKVETLGDEDNLYEAGLTSHANINVMLALEDEFDIEFPDALLRRSTFESIHAIRTTLSGLVTFAPGVSA